MSKTLGSLTANSVKTCNFALATCSAIFGIAVLISAALVSTASADESLVPESKAFRAGLKVQWKSQVSVGGPNKIIDWCLQIDENTSTTYFVIEAGNIREVVSNRQLNSKGEAFGLDGAQEEIDFKKDLLETRMKLRGIEDVEVKLSSYTLPKSTIYTLSSDGLVTAIDADTGDFLWEQLVGDTSLEVVGLGAGNNHVAVVVGSKVYCLSVADGRTLWSKETVYVPSSSPAVSDSNILVPLGNGRLQSFLIEDNGYGSNAFFANGFATARPLVVGDKVAWTTDSGQLNLATPLASRAVSFRLKANASMASAPTGNGTMVYAASLDGFVYGVDQDKGRLVWEVTTGASITQSPVPIGENVYVVSEADQLFKIDAMTGQFSDNWDTPVNGIVKFLGATEESVFALNKQNTLLVIDINSSQTVGAVPVGNIDNVLTNYATDRIYISTDGGLIECVREASSETPVFHNREAMVAQGSGTKGSGTKGSDTKNGSDTKGSGTKGSGTKGSGTKGSGTKGSDTKGSDTKGSDTKGSGTKGSDTKGNDTEGSDTKNPFATEDSSNPFASDEGLDDDDEKDDGNPFN